MAISEVLFAEPASSGPLDVVGRYKMQGGRYSDVPSLEISGQKRTIAWSCEQPKEVLAYLADMQDAIKYALQVGYRDAGLDPVKTIQQVLPVLERSGEARLIVGSIRKPEDVEEIVSAGAHIATITPKVLNAMPFHPKAEETIREFDDAWKEFVAKNNLLLSSLQRPQFHLV